MTDTTAEMKRQKRVEQACEEFLMMADSPDADMLERLIGRYPDCAAELTDFAVEWAVQDMQPTLFQGSSQDGESWDGDWSDDWEAEDGATGAASTPVELAMVRLRQRLGSPVTDPFHGLVAEQLRTLARRLGLDTALLAKLRHRRLVAASVPRPLVEGLAEELRVSLAVIVGHLEAPPLLPAGASFKAEESPRAEAQEDFQVALRRSSLEPEAKKRWTESRV